DLLLVPLGVGEARRQGMFARDFLFVEIGHGRAVVDLAEAVDHGRIGEDGGGELRFARSAVSDERDISDRGDVVDLHTGIPLESKSASYPRDSGFGIRDSGRTGDSIGSRIRIGSRTRIGWRTRIGLGFGSDSVFGSEVR